MARSVDKASRELPRTGKSMGSAVDALTGAAPHAEILRVLCDAVAIGCADLDVSLWLREESGCWKAADDRMGDPTPACNPSTPHELSRPSMTRTARSGGRCRAGCAWGGSAAHVASQPLAALRAMGVRLILDDFGTGYSSLGYLTRLPVGGLKVDRSFVDGLGEEVGDTAIVGAIVGMAHALDIEVTAEGVETAEQLEHLRALGCNLAQGFHLARPLWAPDVTQLLALAPWWLATDSWATRRA